MRTELVSNTVEAVTTYSPYGNLLARTGASGTVYGFTGEQFDSATELLYLRARYYNAALRRFTSRDPWAGNMMRPSTLHGFMYVSNNPVRLMDPLGLCDMSDPYDPYVDYDCLLLAAELARRDPDPSHNFDFYASINYSGLRSERDYLILEGSRATGLSGVIEFFDVDRGAANARLEQLLSRTGLFQVQFFFFKIPGGDCLREEFQDQPLYNNYWGGGTSWQMSHFLTAVSLAYNNLDPQGGPISTRLSHLILGYGHHSFRGQMDTALRLIIGHELKKDYILFDLPGEQFAAFVPQYRSPTEAHIDDFIAALEADLAGDTTARDALLQGILGFGPENPNRNRKGNSFQDLLLSLKGVEFGGMIRTGQLDSSQAAAEWLRRSLSK